MSIHGTIQNGQVQLDGPANLPDGTRVTLWPFDEFEDFEYPHPLAPYDQEKELAILRASIAEMDAGVPGMTVEEAFSAIDAQLAQPMVRTER